jgi:hypothetical protein
MVVGALPVAIDFGDWLPHFPALSAIASDGTNYLVVSCRPISGLFGVFVSASGQVSSSFPIESIPGGDECNQRLAVAFDGANYLVIFQGSSRIHGIRVSPAGVVVGVPFPISSVAGFNGGPAVAFDGTNYLVVWNKFTFSSSQNEIYGAIVSPAGSTAGEFAVTTGASQALAFDGTNYLVVWGNGNDVHGTRVTPAGVVLDPSGIAIAEAAGGKSPGGVAFDGTNYLVIWNHAGKIFGRRVTPAGALLDGAAGSDGIAISTGASSSIAFAGNHFVVPWAVDSPEGTRIFAARVSTAGARVDGSPTDPGVAISGPFMFNGLSPERFVYPVAASSGPSALIAWTRSVEPPMPEEMVGRSDVLAALIFGL